MSLFTFLNGLMNEFAYAHISLFNQFDEDGYPLDDDDEDYDDDEDDDLYNDDDGYEEDDEDEDDDWK